MVLEVLTAELVETVLCLFALMEAIPKFAHSQNFRYQTVYSLNVVHFLGFAQSATETAVCRFARALVYLQISQSMQNAISYERSYLSKVVAGMVFQTTRQSPLHE